MLFLLIFLILLIINPVSTLAKSFTIDKVDIRAFILEDGDLYVEELYSYTFDGSFNGTTRSIGDDDHSGVVFFEGYLAPDDIQIESMNHEKMKRLKVEREDLTFKIHTKSKDENKKVFYRYRIKDATTKFRDTGHFYWRFFDEMNETDLHHLRIQLALINDQSATHKGQIFLHDLTGGKINMSKQHGIVYENELLPAEKTVEIRYLFPQDFLKEAEYTEDTTMLSTFLEEEEAYQKQLEKRSKWNSTAETINSFVVVIVILLILFIIFSWVLKLLTKGVRLQNLEDMDSLLLTAVYRKGILKHIDLVSSLFRLEQNGVLKMERVRARAAYLEDQNAPNHTFLFTVIKDNASLREYEEELIRWLFVTNDKGQKTFSIDRLPFQTSIEKRENQRYVKENKQAEKNFHETFQKWAEMVLMDKEIRKFVKKNTLRNTLIKWGVPLWIILAIFNSYMGMTDGLSVLLIGAGLVLGWTILLRIKRKRFSYPIFMAVAAIFTGVLSYDLSDSFFTLSSLLFVLALFMPVAQTTIAGNSYRKGVKMFRKEISRGSFPLKDSEKWVQHALSLNLLFELKLRYRGSFSKDAETLTPLLSVDTTDIFHYPNHYYYRTYSSSDSGSSGSGSSGGSGGGGGAGAF
nr:DUF2207 domain-containing protein [Fredinandcohnia sp. SECRCQ15]